MIQCQGPSCSAVYTTDTLHWGIARLERPEADRTVLCTSCSFHFEVVPHYEVVMLDVPSQSSRWSVLWRWWPWLK